MLMLTLSCTPDFLRHLAGYKCMCHRSRVSKSGKHTNARLRKIFHNLHEILDFERKTLTKNNSFNLILTHFFFIVCPFRHIFMHIFFGWPFCLRNENHFWKVCTGVSLEVAKLPYIKL